MIIYSISSSNKLHDMPIFIAVSILSPVNTHTFISAYFNRLIVFPTSSCNLSSMAVPPTISMSISI